MHEQLFHDLLNSRTGPAACPYLKAKPLGKGQAAQLACVQLLVRVSAHVPLRTADQPQFTQVGIGVSQKPTHDCAFAARWARTRRFPRCNARVLQPFYGQQNARPAAQATRRTVCMSAAAFGAGRAIGA